MRVLVVDDSPDAADSLAMLLQLWGHEVAVANDPEEALAAARRCPPEIVLLDIGLPGIGGYELAKQLRREGLSTAFLAAITGYGEERDRRRALEAGFDSHLVKPVDPEVLRATIARVQAARPRS
jgi:DNA-binding response OmpR family regulator